MRGRVGFRNYTANFESHNGNQDATGNPTYSVGSDWNVSVAGWPVELTTTSGSEDVKGRQVDAETTHVIYGEYHGGSMVTPTMRCVINGQTYGIVSVYDPEGTMMELRVELKIERNG